MDEQKRVLPGSEDDRPDMGFAHMEYEEEAELKKVVLNIN